jgi:menaquinone-dependent protoporphyrinogen oxidase
MMQKILVTYASRSGSTAEVTAAICQSFVDSGVTVDLLPIQQVSTLIPYQAVIVGSAIRNSKWLPEAIQFVRKHQSMLRHKPFAMFTVCITLARARGEQYRSEVAAWTSPVRRIAAPLSEGIFAGRHDGGNLPLGRDTVRFRLAVALGIFPRGDHRDWNAIRAWAESLKPLLLLPT